MHPESRPESCSASGLIEGGRRHVLQARLKLSGAWWLPANADANADAMAQLRVGRTNGLWQFLWRK